MSISWRRQTSVQGKTIGELIFIILRMEKHDAYLRKKNKDKQNRVANNSATRLRVNQLIRICRTRCVTKCQGLTCQHHYSTIIQHLPACMCAQAINAFFPFSKEESLWWRVEKKEAQQKPAELRKSDAVSSSGTQTLPSPLLSCSSVTCIQHGLHANQPLTGNTFSVPSWYSDAGQDWS